MPERFEIPIPVGEFIEWLDEYGGWKQQGRYSIKSNVWNDEITHDVLAPDRRSSGGIHLRIERDAATMERFFVTVQPYGSEVALSPYLVDYRDSLIAAICERWSQDDGGLTAPAEPEEWVSALIKHGIAHGSVAWWSWITKWTLDYWNRKGRSSLPISGRLDKAIGFSKSTIYLKSDLGKDSGQ